MFCQKCNGKGLRFGAWSWQPQWCDCPAGDAARGVMRPCDCPLGDAIWEQPKQKAAPHPNDAAVSRPLSELELAQVDADWSRMLGWEV